MLLIYQNRMTQTLRPICEGSDESSDVPWMGQKYYPHVFFFPTPLIALAVFIYIHISSLFYLGGKPDDVTVLLAVVKSSSL
jgi:hypothetical protein